MKINPATDMLGVVDVQPTFMPGGELPVPDGDTVVPTVNRLLRHFPSAFATQDWHPPGHSSFASAHPGHAPGDMIEMDYGPQILWPDHAIQNSAGASLHPALDQSRISLIIRKGFHPGIDSYSAFRENDHRCSTGLAGWLRARSVERLFLCGLAADFCVAWSAEDAIAAGFETIVIEDATRAIAMPLPGGGDSAERARARLAALGVRFLQTNHLES
ncbi:bifunctional nicotinamidase/pyrazinamidase [Acetobacteraceae bacterium KSS8]|uniref:nicotinamidase n=1 Tax=Endosaccharibacter trunci TaxID=2812733 RepID=A0ABT1W4G2_9PROT|nr:bifunctional nicotinamidase/pyrazinamidase [Acetobacteraceae bacterium KSS8]